MTELNEALISWVDQRFACARRDGDYIIDADAIHKLSGLAIAGLSVNPGAKVPPAESSVRELLLLFLMDETDERRGLIGNRIAVYLSPLNVASAVLATVATILWCYGAAPLASVDGALAVAGDIQAALSGVSLLSRHERLIVSLLAAAQELETGTTVTAADLTRLSGASKLDAIAVSGIVTTLVRKGAVSWNGKADGPVSLKRWF